MHWSLAQGHAGSAALAKRFFSSEPPPRKGELPAVLLCPLLPPPAVNATSVTILWGVMQAGTSSTQRTSRGGRGQKVRSCMGPSLHARLCTQRSVGLTTDVSSIAQQYARQCNPLRKPQSLTLVEAATQRARRARTGSSRTSRAAAARTARPPRRSRGSWQCSPA